MTTFPDRLRAKAREAENNAIAQADQGKTRQSENFAAIAAALLYCAEAWEEALDREEAA